MRVYLASTADELKEFLESQSLIIDEVYAPTPIYSATHPEMDEEELEYSLSLLAAEDALELMDDLSGAALVLAFEIPEEMLGTFDEVSSTITAPIDWKMMEAIFLVGEDADDLTWFAPQEAESSIDQWMRG
jgi:5,10-methenyltetrahydromethanopterin hydrogenase